MNDDETIKINRQMLEDAWRKSSDMDRDPCLMTQFDALEFCLFGPPKPRKPEEIYIAFDLTSSLRKFREVIDDDK